jgi:hypothetical protein
MTNGKSGAGWNGDEVAVDDHDQRGGQRRG